MMTERVLKRLPDLRLADASALPLRTASFASGPESMPVVFTPSAPLGGWESAELVAVGAGASRRSWR